MKLNGVPRIGYIKDDTTFSWGKRADQCFGIRRQPIKIAKRKTYDRYDSN